MDIVKGVREIERVLKPLCQKIGLAGKTVWPLAVRSQKINGQIFAISSFIFAFFFFVLFGWQGIQWNSEMDTDGHRFLCCIFVFAFIVSTAFGLSGISTLLNAEYEAFKDLVGTFIPDND